MSFPLDTAMAKPTRRVGMQWAIVLLFCYCGFVHANTDEAVYLEGGQRGIVPCPLVQSRQISPSDVIVIYWYRGSISKTTLLISYYFGSIAPQNGIAEGVYDIDDDEFSLVIENVTSSDEGTYHCRVKPSGRMMEDGQVEVRDKVSPRRPYPTVIGCNQVHDADTCQVRVPHDSRVHNLTCVMEQVKPAVDLRWIHLFLGGRTVLNASTTVLPADTGWWLTTNTFSTSASIQVEAVDDEVYECEAVGVAVGGRGVRTRVRLTTIQPTIIHPTTVHPKTTTVGEVQPPNNRGTTLVLTDEVSQTSYKRADLRVDLIVLSVVFVLLFLIVAASTYFLLRRKRYHTRRMEAYKEVSTSTSSIESTETEPLTNV